ncbi:MAG: hypothetical protein K6G10_03505 [Butyrivibrio sp.]|nr:hypothetical protein [Butyrivibrio sp.]
MKKLTANWGLKLASLLFAMVLWFLVTNINDPITSVRYANIPVTLKNTNLITEKDQVCTVLDGSDTISSVTVYAPRSIIDSLSQNNIVATADIQDLTSLNTVSVFVTTNKYSDRIEKIVPSSDVVKLSVEKKASKSLALTATTSGTLADGFIIGDVTTEQNMVRVSGPESAVESVASASVDVDVTGFTSNIGTDADIILYDSEGNELDPNELSLSMNIKTVRVNVVIYETKYVPLSYTVKGDAASGYAFTGEVESNPEEVLLAGRTSVISSINELKVEDEGLDITGQSSNFNYTVELKPQLPSGVIFGDPDFGGTAAVVVHIAPVVEETFDVSMSHINIEGEAEGYKVFVDDSENDTVSVTLTGLGETIRDITPAQLTGTVSIDDILKDNDLTEMKAGTYSAEITWDLPGGVKEKSPVSVHVIAEEK